MNVDEPSQSPAPSRPPSADHEPQHADPQAAEIEDPHSGVSDDPRVDPTPDRRHTR